MDDDSSDKIAKGRKKFVIKRIFKFENYEDCNKANQLGNIIKYFEKNVVNTNVSRRNYEEFIKNNKFILKTQQRFKSKSHNVFTKEINKIALSPNDDKRIQSIHSIETYAYGTNKGLISKTKEIKSNNMIKQCKFDDYTNENKTEHNLKSPYIPDHPYRILIIGGSRSGKKHALVNLVSNQPDIDKIYLYSKDPQEIKYQYLVNKREKVGLKHYDIRKAFIEYSNDMQDVYKNDKEYNLERKGKVLIVSDDMTADMINNKKINPVVTKLYISGRKLNILITFFAQSFFKLP